MKSKQLKELLDKNAGLLYGKAVCKVSQKGECIFEHKINCNIDSIFDLASVSKILTGTMILKLVAEGKLFLEQTLDELFKTAPLGPITKKYFKDITLKNLLTHSSGIPRWFPFYTQKGSFWDVLEIMFEKFPREEGTVYRDPNFMLLGEAIVYASGLTLVESLDLLNKELGTSFTYNPKNRAACVETERGNRIEKKMCEDLGLSFDGFRDFNANMRGEVNDGNCFYFWKGVAGHAGIFGIAEDLIKIGELYRNHGMVNGKPCGDSAQFIPSELAEKSTIDYGGGRGLSWALQDIFIDGYGHTGFTGTSLYIYPAADLVSVILTNRLVIEPAPDLRDFRLQAHKIIHG